MTRALQKLGGSGPYLNLHFHDVPRRRRIFSHISKQGAEKVVNLEGILDIFSDHSCDISLSIRTPRRQWRTHPLFVRALSAGWHIDNNKFFDDWSGQTAPTMEAEGLWTRLNRPKILPCSMLYSGPHFFSDGRATACGCRDLDGKSELRLDSKELLSDMRKVYSTGAGERLRERFRNSDAPAICVSCRHYNPQFEGSSGEIGFCRPLGILERFWDSVAPPNGKTTCRVSKASHSAAPDEGRCSVGHLGKTHGRGRTPTLSYGIRHSVLNREAAPMAVATFRTPPDRRLGSGCGGHNEKAWADRAGATKSRQNLRRIRVRLFL